MGSGMLGALGTALQAVRDAFTTQNPPPAAGADAVAWGNTADVPPTLILPWSPL